jgi:EF-P beta-lysylation protein EpmB
MISTGACAVNCRYCFRRHFPYSNSHAGGNRLESIRQYLQMHQEIEEVILSGGDPLMLDDPQLDRILEGLCANPNIKRIRIHSRLPVVLPERITDQLLQTLTRHKSLILVIHCNHPNELDTTVKQALLSLHQAGVRLYNQSVLLRGVNDNVETLCELSTQLFDSQVQPYYLHCLDKVTGAAHFDLPEDQVIRLYHGIQSNLSGFLLPKLVRDVPGESAKSLII